MPEPDAAGAVSGVVASIVAVLAVGALAVRFTNAGSIDASLTQGWVVVEAVAAIVYGAVGALVVQRSDRRLLGSIFLVVALCYATSAAAAEYGLIGLYYAPGSVPAAGAIGSMQSWLWAPGNALVATMVPAMLPDGRFRSPRWRTIGWGTALALLLTLPNNVTNPWPHPLGPPASPFGVTAPGWIGATELGNRIGLVLLVVLGLAALGSLVLQRREAAPDRRPALTWLLLGSVAVVLPVLTDLVEPVTGVAPPDWTVQALQLVALPLLPIATLVAVLRHRLWGLEVAVRRTLVGSLLAGGVLATYAVAVTASSWLVGSRGLLASGVAAGTVALVFQPARQRLDRAVDRLLYGARHDPWAVVQQLGRVVETPAPAGEVPARIVESLAAELRVEGVELRRGPGRGQLVARSGNTGTDHDVVVALVARGESVGSLVVSPGPGDRVEPRLARGLSALAPQLTATVQSALLLDDLRRSRDALVVAREEERRRLHRELHDGVGPALAGVGLAIQAADNLLADARVLQARELLDRLVAEVERVVGDVRATVEGLRPPLLDELGLLGAIHHHADRWRSSGLRVETDLPVRLRALPAAVEVAAYHVVREAMANIVRHAAATTADVRVVQTTDGLEVEVTDDGSGIDPSTPPGIGLASMRDRVTDSGGALVAAPHPTRGTRVHARWTGGAQP